MTRTNAARWTAASAQAGLLALALIMLGMPAVAQTLPTAPTAPTAPTGPTSPSSPTAPTTPTTPSASTTSPTSPTLPTPPTPPTLPDGGGGGTTTPPTFVQVHLLKYIQDASTTQPFSTATTSHRSFPMEATWTASNLNGGTTTSGTFTLGIGQTDTSLMASGASYSAHEVSSAMASSSDVVGTGAACVAGKYRTVGYRTGDTLAHAQAATLTAAAPSLTNLSSDAYVLVVNEYCTTDNMPPTTGGNGNGNGNGGGTATTTQTIVVHPGDLATSLADASSSSKWFFWNGQTQNIDPSVGTFVTGPGTAPLGTGSVMLMASTTGVSAIGTYQFGGTQLSDISDLSFKTYLADFGMPSGGATTTASTTATTTPDVNAPFISFAPLFSGSGSANGQLMFVPEHGGTVATGTWQTWNLLATTTGMWTWSGYASSSNLWPDANPNQYRSWSSLLSSFPHLAIGTTSPLLGVGITSPNASTTVMAAIDDLTITLGAHGSSTATTTATTTIFDFEPTAVQSSSGGGGGGGGGSSHHSSSHSSSSNGQVLGASCPLITSWMRENQYNDPDQVSVLKNFLNDEMNDDLTVNGTFDSNTTLSVNDFQVKYWQDVLAPWVAFGLPTDHTPTGYVYKTTSTKINRIACPDMTFPDPILP